MFTLDKIHGKGQGHTSQAFQSRGYGIHHINGKQLCGPFTLSLSHAKNLHLSSFIKPQDIAQKASGLIAFSPVLDELNEDFQSMLGFLDKDRFHDDLTHVVFYTRTAPFIYNDQTFPFKGFEVCWPNKILSNKQLAILPALIATHNTISIGDPRLFLSLKNRLNNTVVRLEEDQRLIYHDYLVSSLKEINHH